MNLVQRVRDTITGRYVESTEAKARPETTVTEMQETGLDETEVLARRLAKINQLATNRMEDLRTQELSPGMSARDRNAWLEDLDEVGKLARGESR